MLTTAGKTLLAKSTINSLLLSQKITEFNVSDTMQNILQHKDLS